MTNLKSRLRAAEGVDRADFCQVMQAFGLKPSDEIWQRIIQLCQVKAWESAALALVREVDQTVRYISWHRFNGDPEVVHATVGLTRAESKVGIHKEPAIAVLIALLATLQAKEAQEDE